MQTGPLARPRLNTLQASMDEQYFASNQWLPAGSNITAIYNQLFSTLGLPAGACNCYASNADACAIVTGEKPAWATLTDLADYTNTMIKVSPLSIINVYDNHIWRTDITGSGAYGTPAYTWTRSNAKAATFIAERATSVRQLRMTWLNSGRQRWRHRRLPQHPRRHRRPHRPARQHLPKRRTRPHRAPTPLHRAQLPDDPRRRTRRWQSSPAHRQLPRPAMGLPGRQHRRPQRLGAKHRPCPPRP